MIALRWVSIAVLFALLAGCGSSSAGIPSTPDGTVQKVTSDLANDRPQIVFQALPTSYQNDVREVIVAFANKLDADLWNRTFAVLGKIARIAKEKKEFILGAASEAPVPQLQGENLEKLNENWDRVIAIFETIVASEIKTVDGIKKLDPEKFLATTGAQLSKNIKDLATAVADEETAEVFEKIGQTKVTVVKNEGETATLSIETPGQETETLDMVRFEGRWLPSDLVAKWDAGIEHAKQSIAQIDFNGPSRQMYLGVLTQVEQTLDQLLAASNQEQFNQALAGLQPIFGGFLAPKFNEIEPVAPAIPNTSDRESD